MTYPCIHELTDWEITDKDQSQGELKTSWKSEAMVSSISEAPGLTVIIKNPNIIP